jgi:hypothetical protein
MQSMSSINNKHILWKQTIFGAYDFELLMGDDLKGRMYWPKWLSDQAVAVCAEGEWLIDRVGFFRDRAVMLDMQSETKIASVDFKLLGDFKIKLNDEREFELFRTKAFCEHWALTDENDVTVLEINAGMHWFKHVAEITLAAKIEDASAVPALIMLSWYLVFMNTQDAAAAIAATTAACY